MEISIFLRKSLKKLVNLVNLESFWRCRNTKIIRKHSSKPQNFLACGELSYRQYYILRLIAVHNVGALTRFC